MCMCIYQFCTTSLSLIFEKMSLFFLYNVYAFFKIFLSFLFSPQPILSLSTMYKAAVSLSRLDMDPGNDNQNELYMEILTCPLWRGCDISRALFYKHHGISVNSRGNCRFPINAFLFKIVHKSQRTVLITTIHS